jgi:hypothetical protein
MDLGHFATAGGIELTKIAERGWAPPTTPRGVDGVGWGRVGTTGISSLRVMFCLHSVAASTEAPAYGHDQRNRRELGACGGQELNDWFRK